MKLNKILKSFITVFTFFITLFTLNSIKTSAASLTLNGTFEAPIKLDLKMGADAFSDKVIIEHMDDNYYLTFTQVDSSNLANMTLIKAGKVGVMEKVDGIKKSYTYTLTLDDLSKPLKFGVTVTVMNKYVEFTMTIDLHNSKYLSSTIEDRGERPALYIPTITTNASNQEMEKGTNYFIPSAKAELNGKDIEVLIKVYYNENDTLKEVAINNGILKLDLLGEYVIKYIATSDIYKTSLGNNTTTEIVVRISSKTNASTLSKVEDVNNILPSGYQIQTTILSTGETFDKVSNLMKNTSENYQVFKFDLYTENGEELVLNGEIKLYLRADDYFNRQEIKVYFLNEDGTTEELANENYGRYISLNTKKAGTFIVFVPGVAFVMPMWGYALIIVGALVIVGSVITISIVLVKKNKKKKLK